MIDIAYYVSNNAPRACISLGEAEIYEGAIEKVCEKLGVDADKIKWMIYEPEDPPPTNSYDPVIKPNKLWTSYINEPVNKYYCNIQEKRIYISNRSLLLCTGLRKNELLKKEDPDISLIDELLINAITRLQTQTTEDNDFFKKKLKENFEKFSEIDFS